MHRKRALTQQQSTPDPGQEWLEEHGDLMDNALHWMEQAYLELPNKDVLPKLESVFRAIEHMGKPVDHMDHTIVYTHMADLPEALKNSLRDTMQNGVKTGIPRPEFTNEVKSSNTALEYADKVGTEMRKSAVHGWVRVFSPSRRKYLEDKGILLSQLHYVVPPNDRVVIDLTGSGANAASPECEHGYEKERVQCDYLVVEQLVQYLELARQFTGVELISIKTDIKSAFMRIPLHLDSTGTFAMEWQQHPAGG